MHSVDKSHQVCSRVWGARANVVSSNPAVEGWFCWMTESRKEISLKQTSCKVSVEGENSNADGFGILYSFCLRGSTQYA